MTYNIACGLLTVPRCPHYTKCMFVRRRLTCSNGMRPTLQLTNPFSFLVEWPAACSRYPSTDTTTNHIRSPAALLKWPAARSRYPSTDTRRIPAKMAGMRLAHVTHVEVHVRSSSASLITWLQHINFRDAACSWYPCAHTTRSACSLDASLLTWPAVCSRYPSTGFRSPAYLLKWHPVRLARGTHVPTLHEVHVRTSPASLLRHGLRPANGTHLPPLQQINVRDAACSRYPCAHTRRSACSLVAGLPAHMACGLLTVPVYLLPTLRQSVVGFSAHMACGLLTAPVYRHYASAVVVLPVRMLCALLTVPSTDMHVRS